MRVVSLHPVTTELLFSIGAADALVGRTDQCTYPDQALKVPSVGEMEDISNVIVDVFEPSIVLTGPGQRELANELGSSYRVVYFDPQSLEDLFSGIVALGAMLKRDVEADMIVHDIRIVLDRISQQASKFSKVRVYCECDHAPALGPGYVQEILTLAGGQPFLGPVTVEQLQEFDPQMIISSVPSEEEFNFELLTARDGWSDLNAVRYERLFTLPGTLLHRPGPRMVKGIKRIAKILHGIHVDER